MGYGLWEVCGIYAAKINPIPFPPPPPPHHHHLPLKHPWRLRYFGQPLRCVKIYYTLSVFKPFRRKEWVNFRRNDSRIKYTVEKSASTAHNWRRNNTKYPWRLDYCIAVFCSGHTHQYSSFRCNIQLYFFKYRSVWWMLLQRSLWRQKQLSPDVWSYCFLIKKRNECWRESSKRKVNTLSC